MCYPLYIICFCSIYFSILIYLFVGRCIYVIVLIAKYTQFNKRRLWRSDKINYKMSVPGKVYIYLLQSYGALCELKYLKYGKTSFRGHPCHISCFFSNMKIYNINISHYQSYWWQPDQKCEGSWTFELLHASICSRVDCALSGTRHVAITAPRIRPERILLNGHILIQVAIMNINQLILIKCPFRWEIRGGFPNDMNIFELFVNVCLQCAHVIL